MLTEAEKAACRATTWVGNYGTRYGTPGVPHDPITMVALMRGAVLKQQPWGDMAYTWIRFYSVGDGYQGCEATRDTAIARQAEADVLAWTGYASFFVFLDALTAHGPAIFPSLEKDTAYVNQD